MSYFDKIKKYKDGELSDAQVQEVEGEIEKVQAITQYIDEALDDAIFNGVKGDEEENWTQDVSKAVNKKLRKYSIVASGVVLVIVLFLIFGLSPLMDRMFYNPAEEVSVGQDDGEYTAQSVRMPMEVYLELFCGARGFADNIWAQSLGYGKYSLDVPMQLDGVVEHNYLTLDKGTLVGANNQWNRSGLYGNSFAYGNYSKDSDLDLGEANDRIEDLPKAARVKACITFNKTLDMKELMEFMDRNSCYYVYVPVIVDDSNYLSSYIGFSPEGVGYELSDYGYYDKEKYPYLELSQYKEEKGTITAEALETHFKSMMAYMSSNDMREFNQMVLGNMNLDGGKSEYIEENGVTTYGIVVYDSAENIMKLEKDNLFKTMSIVSIDLK